MNPIREIQRARLFIYKKQKNYEPFIFICKKPDTFQKARHFPLRFYSQKALHCTLRGFHEIFEIGIYIY